jgi:hypothetical protein
MVAVRGDVETVARQVAKFRRAMITGSRDR